jgi:hypothetical protein
MAISLYEKFTGVDWQRIAYSFGTCMVMLCLCTGVLNMFVGVSFELSLFLIVTGLVIAIWEMPTLFVFIPQCTTVTEFAAGESSTLKLNIPAARSVLYLCLSFLFMHGSVTSIIIGLAFLVSSALYLFAHINVVSDTHDGTTNSGIRAPYQMPPGSESSTLESKLNVAGFGTF